MTINGRLLIAAWLIELTCREARGEVVAVSDERTEESIAYFRSYQLPKRRTDLK